ncbi:hypothetical protein V2J09_011119 [Rumex salicifolius]
MCHMIDTPTNRIDPRRRSRIGAMSLARLPGCRRQLLQNLRSQSGHVGCRILPPSSYAMLSRFSADAADAKEVAVESAVDDEKKKKNKKRWRSVLPWRHQRRRNNLPLLLPSSFNGLFGSGIGNALLEATENFNSLLEDVARSSGMMGHMKEKDDSYKLHYEVPGLAKEDLKITVQDGILTIVGEEQGYESDNEGLCSSSTRYNARIVLPDDAKHDDIKAELKDGVLTILVPKDDTKAKQVKEVAIH